MNLLFVVQRYGADVAGGAEAHCRMFAERLAARGHDVTVLTSCARDYDTWADAYPPGVERIDGVDVHRLGVVAPRATSRFDAVSRRVAGATRPDPVVEEAWMFEQGPILRGFGPELRRLAVPADVVIFFTYLYATTVHGLSELGGLAPAILHPTAHDEWPLRLPSIRSAFDRVDGLAVSTPEERELVELRFRPRVPCEVIGIGFEEPARRPSPTDVRRFRDRFGLSGVPYVLCLGRVDPNKGSGEAIRFMSEYRRRSGTDAALVMCGADMMDVAPGDGLVVTGFVDDDERWTALAGASVLLQPSRQESFGMTLAEAWLTGLPVLVQEGCDVTTGLARRSGGGLAYGEYSSFEAALGLLLEHPERCRALGDNGRRYIAEQYSWDAVLGRYESLLERVVSSRPSGR